MPEERMTSTEYRLMMGLDDVPGEEPLKVKITKKTKEPKQKPGLADGFLTGMNRMVYRLIWLAGWAWMLFTFGWVGHFMVTVTERKLKKDVDDTG